MSSTPTVCKGGCQRARKNLIVSIIQIALAAILPTASLLEALDLTGRLIEPDLKWLYQKNALIETGLVLINALLVSWALLPLRRFVIAIDGLMSTLANEQQSRELKKTSITRTSFTRTYAEDLCCCPFANPLSTQ